MRRALATIALLAAATLSAAARAGAEERTLVVGTKQAAPFAVKEADGSWSGISVELWEEIADDLGVRSEYRELDLEPLLAELEAGHLDVAVAALTATRDREERFDFSHPYYSSGLGIAVRAQGGRALGAVVAGLFSLQFLRVLGALLALLFGVGTLVWLFERRRNPEQFGGGARQGLGSAFWWSTVTMTTVGYGDKAPRSAGGRAIAILWMFASVVLISSFTAAITSALTVGRLRSGIEGPQDLVGRVVATVPGSTSESFLRERRVETRAVGSPGEGLEALARGEVDAVVYDEPILRYLVQADFAGRIRVLPRTFERQDYVLGLPAGSPLREPINRALLDRIHRSEWTRRLEGYLGD